MQRSYVGDMPFEGLLKGGVRVLLPIEISLSPSGKAMADGRELQRLHSLINVGVIVIRD